MKTHGTVTLQHNHTAQADLSVNHTLFLISRGPSHLGVFHCGARWLTFTLQYPDTTWCLRSDRDPKREFYTSTSAAGNESQRPRIPVNQYQYVGEDWKHIRTPVEVPVPHTTQLTLLQIFVSMVYFHSFANTACRELHRAGRGLQPLGAPAG